MVTVDHGPAHDEAAQRGEHEQVHERLSLGAYTGGVDALGELLARERPSCSRERSMTATPLSAALGVTPSWARRRALPVSRRGAVSACSQG